VFFANFGISKWYFLVFSGQNLLILINFTKLKNAKTLDLQGLWNGAD
jgi:hypothetical protein